MSMGSDTENENKPKRSQYRGLGEDGKDDSKPQPEPRGVSAVEPETKTEPKIAAPKPEKAQKTSKEVSKAEKLVKSPEKSPQSDRSKDITPATPVRAKKTTKSPSALAKLSLVASVLLLVGVIIINSLRSSPSEVVLNNTGEGKQTLQVSAEPLEERELDNPDVVSHQERFEGIVYALSHQPLLTNDQGNPTSAKDFAFSVFGSENVLVLKTDKGDAYVQDDSSGTRTAIFSHDGQLIIITAPSAATDDNIISYIDALSWR